MRDPGYFRQTMGQGAGAFGRGAGMFQQGTGTPQGWSRAAPMSTMQQGAGAYGPQRNPWAMMGQMGGMQMPPGLQRGAGMMGQAMGGGQNFQNRQNALSQLNVPNIQNRMNPQSNYYAQLAAMMNGGGMGGMQRLPDMPRQMPQGYGYGGPPPSPRMNFTMPYSGQERMGGRMR